jgi:hypothetical protein
MNQVGFAFVGEKTDISRPDPQGATGTVTDTLFADPDPEEKLFPLVNSVPQVTSRSQGLISPCSALVEEKTDISRPDPQSHAS